MRSERNRRRPPRGSNRNVRPRPSARLSAAVRRAPSRCAPRRGNVGSRMGSMTRRRFLGTAAAGAAGLAGSAMIGNVGAATNNDQGDNDQGGFNVGVIAIGPSHASWGGDLIGELVYKCAQYALKKTGDHFGYDFNVYFADGGCGLTGYGWNALLNLKYEKKCDFIIGPTCSGSAANAVAVPGVSVDDEGEIIIPGNLHPEYEDVWADTCMITGTADGSVNITVAEDNRDFFNDGTFHYHLLAHSAVDKDAVLGRLVCQDTQDDVAIIYETGSGNDPYVLSIVDGISAGYTQEGCSNIPGEIGVPRDVTKIEEAILANWTRSALIFVSNTDMAAEVSQALENAKDEDEKTYTEAGGTVYVSSTVGEVSGATTASLVFDPDNSGTLLGENWSKLIRKSGVDLSAFDPFGPTVASLYVAQLMEASYVLGELICQHRGNVHAVNQALTAGTYPTDKKSTGLFYGVTWDGVNVFPTFAGGSKPYATTFP